MILKPYRRLSPLRRWLRDVRYWLESPEGEAVGLFLASAGLCLLWFGRLRP